MECRSKSGATKRQAYIAAHLRVDGSGLITHAGGQLERYGLVASAQGQAYEDAAPFLVGLLPLTARSLSLRWIQVGPPPSAIADLHLMQDGDAVWVLLLDATDAALQVRAMQQRGTEITLERDRLAKRIGELEAEIQSIRKSPR